MSLQLFIPLVGGPKDGRDPWLAPEPDRAEGGEHPWLSQMHPASQLHDRSVVRQARHEGDGWMQC